MADAKKSSRVVDTWRQKKWYTVLSPALFGSRPIGETFGMEDSQIIGRTLKISLAAVTGDPKKQSTNAIFEISKVNAGNAETITKKMEIAPSSIRRMIRKGKDRVDLSIICATKDDIVVRIKPFLVTRGKIGGSVGRNLRNLLDAVLRNEVSQLSFENLIKDVVIGNVQKKIRMRLNRIYPLKIIEIRSLEKTIATGPLPPIPELPEIKEEVSSETEEEKIEKKVKAKKTKDEASEEA